MLANYYKITIPKEHMSEAVAQMRLVQNHIANNAEGCIKFHFTQDIDSESIIYLFTVWDTKENYEKNLVSEYNKVEIFDKLIEYKSAIVSAEQFIISKHNIVA